MALFKVSEEYSLKRSCDPKVITDMEPHGIGWRFWVETRNYKDAAMQLVCTWTRDRQDPEAENSQRRALASEMSNTRKEMGGGWV